MAINIGKPSLFFSVTYVGIWSIFRSQLCEKKREKEAESTERQGLSFHLTKALGLPKKEVAWKRTYRNYFC